MINQDPTLNRYLNGDYASQNPDWDSGDANWKAEKLHYLLSSQAIKPKSIVEIGCGSGNILVSLHKFYPNCELRGFDIAPDAERFWKKHESTGIRFKLADYLTVDEPVPDLLLLFDVLEHLGNPWQFLSSLHDRTNMLAIHFPLDLSVISVLREHPLLTVRNKVGHLHFFTKNLAISLLEETGYDIIEAHFTNAALEIPKRTFKTKLAGVARKLAYALNHEFGARILGGETLIVLAKPRKL